MSIPIFEIAEPLHDQVEEAVLGLADRKYASDCVDKGIREFTSGRVRGWVPKFALLAGQQAGRVNDVLGYYDSFLHHLDKTTKEDWYPTFIGKVPADNLLNLSGRFGEHLEEFNAELSRVVAILGEDKEEAVLDFGCAAEFE